MSDLRNGINRMVGNTKRNRAGNQQPYVPAGNGDESGEYADNLTGSNIHYNSPTKEPGIALTNKGDKPTIETIKSKYDGKGKEKLVDFLQRTLPKSANTRYVIDSLRNADDELSGVLGDFLTENLKIDIKIGKKLNSQYMTSFKYNRLTGEKFDFEYSVRMGQGILNQSEYYSEGGVFFHEVGHALDDSYIDDLGHKGHWSCDYISEKYGKALKDMINEEIKQNLSYDEAKKLRDSIAEQREVRIKELFKEREEEYQILKQEFWDREHQLLNDEIYKSLQVECEEKLNVVGEKRALWMDNYGSQEKADEYTNARKEWRASQDKLTARRKEIFDSMGYDVEANQKRREELNNQRSQLYEQERSKDCIIYGDLSDMTMGNVGIDVCGMGHGDSYWRESLYNHRNQGKECFAEMMSASGTNPQSLEVIKKYAPKSYEIFTEIINKIKSGKNQYKKELF